MGKIGAGGERLPKAGNGLGSGGVPLKAARDAAREEAERAFAEADDARARLADANGERERLLARVAELEEEQQALSEISEEVETRLDGAIAQIRRAMGRKEMPLVNVMGNSRSYTIACDEGEEPHLKELAAHVDAKVKELIGTAGQVGDQKLLL